MAAAAYSQTPSSRVTLNLLAKMTQPDIVLITCPPRQQVVVIDQLRKIPINVCVYTRTYTWGYIQKTMSKITQGPSIRSDY